MKTTSTSVSGTIERPERIYIPIPRQEEMRVGDGLTRRVKMMNLLISRISYRAALHQIIDRASLNLKGYCCFVNAHVTVEAQDPEYARMVNRSMLSVSDGMSLVFAMKFLYGIQQDRIAGMDMINSVLQECDKKKLRVFIFGGSPEAQDAFTRKIQTDFPNTAIAGSVSPPMGEIDTYDNDAICHQINESGANLVFVCLGCPKQEKWMAKYSNRIDAVLLGIGGAMPVLAGQVSRAPGWMQTSGFEWLYRLMKEPKRLWKRYLTTNFLFVYGIIKQKSNLNGARDWMQASFPFAKPSQKVEPEVLRLPNKLKKV